MKTTPFHPRTSELIDSYDWNEWSGWLSANVYDLLCTNIKSRAPMP